MDEQQAELAQITPYERKAGNWLNAYLEYTKESESPDTYHTWIALHCLASVVKRNVFLDQGLYVLYPNLYIALVGPPGRTAKSTALHLGAGLLYSIPGIRFGPNSCSREELIHQMAEAKLDNVCALTISSSEFSSLVDVSGITMFQFLTDIFDGNYAPPKGWDYSTKNKGRDLIVNPILNVVVGTTPDYLADSMPSNVVGHGFTARTIFVYEEEERLINPLPDNLNLELGQALIEDLKHIAHIREQFRWTDESRVVYKAYYQSLYAKQDIDHRLAGFHWRKKVHVLKVAMLLALAERDECVLYAQDINAAAALIGQIEPNMSRAFSAVGKYEHASDIERMGSIVLAHREGLPVSQLFRQFYYSGSPDEVAAMVSGLVRMGVCKFDRRKGNEEWIVPVASELPWTTGRKNGNG